MSQLNKPFLKIFSIEEKIDPKNNIHYLIKRVGTNHHSMIIFLTGIGLDYNDFHIPFVLSSSKNILIAPTVPGFEPGYSGPALSMAEQAKKLGIFIKTISSEYEINRIKLYGFSYGSDLINNLLDTLSQYHKMSKPRIEKIILTEINVDEESCFITSKIKNTEKIELSLRHSDFFFNILQCYNRGELDIKSLSPLSVYYSKIINKSWIQLVQTAKEVTQSPNERLQEIINKTKKYQDIPFSYIFSDPRDRLVFENTLMKMNQNQPVKNLKIHSVEDGHFSHVDPEGILRNLEFD